MSHPPLSDDHDRILRFEAAHPSGDGTGTKERLVAEQLGMSHTRYWQILNALIDDPAALAAHPTTIHRLRRLREQRRRRWQPSAQRRPEIP